MVMMMMIAVLVVVKISAVMVVVLFVYEEDKVDEEQDLELHESSVAQSLDLPLQLVFSFLHLVSGHNIFLNNRKIKRKHCQRHNGPRV